MRRIARVRTCASPENAAVTRQLTALAFAIAVAATFAAVTGDGSAGAATTAYDGTLPDAGVAWVSDDSHPAPASDIELRNREKAFVPDLLIVTAGSDVRFPNDDDFFHSIYSSSGPNPFDIGFYDHGPGKDVVFRAAGVAAIRCHIHGSMHATIVVVDGPYARTHAPNERYHITGVRPGRHVVHEWTQALGERTRLANF